jgi:hypothetical protein
MSLTDLGKRLSNSYCPEHIQLTVPKAIDRSPSVPVPKGTVESADADIDGCLDIQRLPQKRKLVISKKSKNISDMDT